MKKLSLLFIVSLFWQIGFTQLSLTNQGNGVVLVDYGASTDYSIYDPQGDTQIYLYLWINADQTTPNLSATYNDDWNDTAGLIVLNYDNNAQKFTGTIDFNTHNFSGEGVVPQNTQINDFNLILRSQDGSRQSADLSATNYGFQATTIVGMTEIKASEIIHFAQGKLFLNPDYTRKLIDLQLFDMSGKMVLNQRMNSHSYDLGQFKNAVYIIKVIINHQKYAVLKIAR